MTSPPALPSAATSWLIQDLDPESDELLDWFTAIRLTFKDQSGPVAADQVAARRPGYANSLLSAAKDGGQVVGTIRSFPTALTVPGVDGSRASVAGSAITAVTVLPTHRRRGAMSALVTRHLQAARDQGAAVAVLIASEAEIYGRFGFGPCTESADWTVDLRTARLRAEAPRSGQGGGTVKIVPRAELRPVAPTLYQASRQAGDLDRPDPAWWDPRLGITRIEGVTDDSVVTVLATDSGGTPTGYLRYSAKADWVDRACHTQVTVHDLRTTTPQAYADLWGYLLELDLVVTVIATERSVDEPLPLLLADPRAARQTGRCDFLWSRVLDPVAALSGRGYERDGDLTLRVIDPGGPADGSFRLRVADGRATCDRTGRPADVELPVDVLGSVWLGGGDLRGYALAGRATEATAGALSRLAALLRSTVAPWSSTWF